jgi:hypothetical protein
MKHDKILIAGLIGGISTLAGEIVTKILVACGIGQYAVFELNSLVVTINRPSMVIGFIINFIIGSYVSALLYLVFTKLGHDHLIIKAAMGCLLLWFVFETGFSMFIENHVIPIRPIADLFVHLAGTAAYGLSVGVFLKIFIFRKETENTKETPQH